MELTSHSLPSCRIFGPHASEAQWIQRNMIFVSENYLKRILKFVSVCMYAGTT